MSPFYRIKQVWWAVSAQPLNPQARQEVKQVLSVEEASLFETFSVNDQNHGLRVLQRLQSVGEASQSLLKAALLHDIGKTRTDITVIDRSLAVAGQILLNRQVASWGMLSLQDARRYHRPFVVKAQHAQWGAEMVEEIGGDRLTIRLIARHQDPLHAIESEEDRLLAQLQWADDLS